MKRRGFFDVNIALGFLEIIALIIAIAFVAMQPYFEATTYTRLTGKSVSYWDAVWLDLRIQEQVK